MKPEITLLDEGRVAEALAVFRALDYDVTMTARNLAHLTHGDPTSPPALRLMALVDGQVTGFAVGCIRNTDTLVVKYIAVRPEWRQRGIATALLCRLEEAARALGPQRAIAGGMGPNYFYPGVDLAQTAALSFFWRHGYETDRVARVDMRVDLAQAPLDVSEVVAACARKGIALRRITHDDLAALAAFGGQHSEAWRTEVCEAGVNDPITGFAAFDRGEPVSFAVYGVSGPNRFGPTLTHPGYRQQGIGGALLKLCLADLRDQGWPYAEISWAGPVQYYARTVGATVHKAYWVFTKSLGAPPDEGQ